MFLECVLVSVDYGDFLRLTLPENKGLFDRCVVVTSRGDEETQSICAAQRVECVISHRVHARGAAFNKGAALNDGLRCLDRNGWVLLTDADMLLPRDLRETLESRSLDPEMIYGTTRCCCPDFPSWVEYQRTGVIGRRWKRERSPLSVGMGFFQLVYGRCSVLQARHLWYSEQYGHAGRSDREFLRLWPPAQRGRLRGVLPIHLVSAPQADVGANWRGRVTPRFG